MTTHFCAMCSFETDDEAAAYAHDCMKPTESRDSVETGDDIGGKSQAESWWAACFPQWRGRQ
jgi:hypothetical protein